MDDVLHDDDDVRAWLAAHVYAPRPSNPVVGQVGLELELFPFWLAQGRRPAARLALVEIVAIVDDIHGIERSPGATDARPAWFLDGTLVTEEPGAQLELAGPPQPDCATAIDDLEGVLAKVWAGFGAAGAGLAAAGLDCWSRPEQVPVQLEVPRYEAMTTYFGRRGGEYGHLLMCASASIQVNLDLGPPDHARRRWLLANLVAPVLTAAFAASPRPGAVNGRAMGWRKLDPTRTGVPPPLVAGNDDPLEHAVADALRADVMLLERDGRYLAGEPGWRFGRWVAEGHPRYGHPRASDLSLHLTTLFPEARLRGYVEIRGVDALPGRWLPAAITLVTSLFYDDRTMEAALDRLRPHRARLPELLQRAATRGLGDEDLGPLARAVLEAALAGAERLAIPQAGLAEEFLERFTRRGRHPSDELREALADGPEAAWRWASA
ncbi:MAG: hypothetical protein KY469_02230 [Actinobacteria bacterium]|nr:hypothetical protein [Actinomycetota bacterium]